MLFDCVDMSKVNAWLLYRRQCNQLQALQRKKMSLLTFVSKIADDLGSANKVPRVVDRPSNRKSTDDVPADTNDTNDTIPDDTNRSNHYHVMMLAMIVYITGQN